MPCPNASRCFDDTASEASSHAAASSYRPPRSAAMPSTVRCVVALRRSPARSYAAKARRLSDSTRSYAAAALARAARAPASRASTRASRGAPASPRSTAASTRSGVSKSLA